MKKILIILIFLPLFGFTQEINLYNIPDPAFLSWLEDNHPQLIVNDSLDIVAASLYSYIEIQYTNISNLDGLEYFINISNLYIYGNSSLTMLPDLTGLTNLFSASINNNNALACIEGYPEPMPEYFEMDNPVPLCVIGCTDSQALNFNYEASIDDDNCDYNDGFIITSQPTTLTVPSQFTSIQMAINMANKGDTILVSPGTYYENLEIINEVVLISSGGFEQTIIQGNNTTSTVIVHLDEVASLYNSISNYFINNYDDMYLWEENPTAIIDSLNSVLQTNVVLDGFTVTGGIGSFPMEYSNNRWGGGVLVERANFLKMNNCFVNNNTSFYAGGLGVMSFAHVYIDNSIIKNNQASGGGVYIRTNVRDENLASNITNSNISDNYASDENESSVQVVTQNSIVNIEFCTIITRDYPNFVISSYFSEDNLWAPTSIKNSIYSHHPSNSWNSNSLFTSFLQTNNSGFIDYENGDYHLSENSICIGAGIIDEATPIYDIEGNPRPNPVGSNPDIGAFEHELSTPQIETYPIDEGFLMLLNQEYPELIYNDSLNVNVAGTFTDLWLFWGNVEDFDGLQFFTNLESLSIEGNSGANIPVLPSNLISLYIYGSFTLPDLGNNITQLSISENDSISEINLPDSLQILSVYNCDSLLSIDDIPTTLTSLTESNNPLLVGCYDIDACNLDYSNAANNVCDYPEVGYDCDGNYYPEIGEEYQGGIVFYIGENGQHGLIAAAENYDYLISEESYVWGCQGESIDSQEEDLCLECTGDYGNGDIYTNTILEFCTETPTAASFCNEFEHQGYDDWYLPNISELELLRNYIQNSLGYVWTSVEHNSTKAKTFELNPNSSFWNISWTTKSSSLNVLPVRKFGNWNWNIGDIGCMDELACNYYPTATEDDGECEYLNECEYCMYNDGLGDFLIINWDSDGDGVCSSNQVDGCINDAACNFNPLANYDDESCEYPSLGYNCNDECLSDTDGDGVCDGYEIVSCKDELACNYDSDLTSDTLNTLCYYSYEYYNCDNECVSDSDNDGVCDELEIFGCTELWADNYNSDATDEDNSCYKIGCTDSWADNFDSLATVNNGLCFKLGCTELWAENFEVLATENDSSCYLFACSETWADNYNENATENDNSCYKEGCTDNWADNYDSIATINNNSCYLLDCSFVWAENFNPLTTEDDGSCYLNGCIEIWADNYNENGTIDDGSCFKMGCTELWAENFDELATVDDSTCYLNGCMDSSYIEFNPIATINDGTCEIGWSEAYYNLIDSIIILNNIIDSYQNSITLTQGWNMIGYGCPEQVDASIGLENYTFNIIIVKDNNGNIYMPEFGFNGIGDLLSGYGYKIKVSQGIDYFYLCND